MAGLCIRFDYRDIDDGGELLELRDFLRLQQLGANNRAFLGDGKKQAIEVVEVRVGKPQLDDSHLKVFFHPLVRLAFGADAETAGVNVVIQVLEFGFGIRSERETYEWMEKNFEMRS